MSKAVAGLGRSDVKNIVVCLRTVSRTDYLVCYYESEQSAKFLADYMLPDMFMRVEHMPRNLNGKIIRKDLPKAKAHTHEITALDSETLERVVWAAEDVLGITSAELEETFTYGIGRLINHSHEVSRTIMASRHQDYYSPNPEAECVTEYC